MVTVCEATSPARNHSYDLPRASVEGGSTRIPSARRVVDFELTRPEHRAGIGVRGRSDREYPARTTWHAVADRHGLSAAETDRKDRVARQHRGIEPHRQDGYAHKGAIQDQKRYVCVAKNLARRVQDPDAVRPWDVAIHSHVLPNVNANFRLFDVRGNVCAVVRPAASVAGWSRRDGSRHAVTRRENQVGGNERAATERHVIRFHPERSSDGHDAVLFLRDRGKNFGVDRFGPRISTSSTYDGQEGNGEGKTHPGSLYDRR
jgi:hypothetical protein